MSSIVFVHGTGVRQPSYDQTFAAIEQGLQSVLPACELKRCYWGEAHGARLRQQGDSIPGYATARAIGDPASAEEEELALWELLYQDPLYELRMLATTQHADEEELAPGQVPPWPQLQDQVAQFQPSAELTALLAEQHLEDAFASACQNIRANAVLDDAIQHAGSDAAEAIAMLARALVAQTIVTAAAAGVPVPHSSARDAQVARVIAELGGGARSISGWIVNPIKGLAMRLATRKLERKRGAFSDAVSPVAGDILLYQTRGAEIRAFIRDKIMRAGDDVYVLAHSLGGIACVDLLVQEHLTNVSGLITAGSQAPLLYEIDSLASLRYGEKLPAHFPRWLNLYDPHDFLSYIGEKIFPGKVQDCEVESGQPFPQSHSAYWSQPQLWQKIADFSK